MDYKKKYEDAVKKLEKFFINDNDRILYKHDIENVFPELKKSEDVRIRNEIIQSIQDNMVVIHKDKCIAWLEKVGEPQVRTSSEWVRTVDDACEHRYAEEYAHGEYCHQQSFRWGFQEGVDWLEKQGEQKPTFCHHEVDLSDCSEEYRKAYYDGWNNCNQQHAQLEAEQKPTWSEEDKLKMDTLIHVIANQKGSAIFEGLLPEELVNWLKSLRERMKGE